MSADERDRLTTERMDALTQANIRLLHRVSELERRVAELESALGVQPLAPEPAGAPAPPPPAAHQPEAVPAWREAAEPRALETRLGLTWVNRVAVLTCMFAVAFFFKYAVDNQWIGPAGRVILGVLAGVGALGAADVLWRRNHRVYAQGIGGLGIAILYLSFQASFAFYGLLPQGPAFALMALTTAIAGALALRYNSLAVAALGAIGGYLTPLLLSTGVDRPWFFLSYLILLSLGALAVARQRSWRALEALAFAATVLLFATWLDRAQVDDSKRLPASLFLLAFYALYATLPRRAIFYIAHLVAAVALDQVWPQQPPVFLAILFGITLAGLAISNRRNWAAGPLVVFFSFALSFWAWEESLRTSLTLATHVGYLALAFLLFLAWLPWRVLVRDAAPRWHDLAVIVANAAHTFAWFYVVLEDDYRQWTGFSALALAVAHLGPAWLLRKAREAPRLLSGIALALITLAIPIQFAGFRITMAWAAEAAAVAWIAARTQSKHLAAAGLGLLGLVLIRLVWIDARMDPERLVLNARFLCFLVAVLAFWWAVHWLRQEWPGWETPLLAAYTLGHAMLVSALALELVEWAARNTAPENLRNAQSASLSILFALYAVALAAFGVATRTRTNRILGLALIALVVAKLYLYDVWELRLLYRVAAFTGLGGLMLAMSFLYSRYRASIESWIQQDKGKSS